MRYSVHDINNKKKWTIVAAISILLAALCMFLPHMAYEVYGYTAATGTVIDGPVRVRTSPVDGEKIVALNPGETVTVVEEAAGSDGYVWYQVQVSVNGAVQVGFVRSDFVRLQTAEATEGNAVVANTDLGVNVRSGAGTSYSVVIKIFKGQRVNVLSQVTAEGMNWYNVSFALRGNTYTGWMCADYVTVDGTAPDGGSDGLQETTTTVTDEQYIAQLQAAGFPASYCYSLLALHQKYPNWQFVPVQTGLDWNTVIQNESVVSRNLIQSSANDSRKSTDSAAYDWATNTWYGFDGANWVSASPEYIAYCMDPRNFLNETYIFQFETLEYAPYQSTAGVSNILANTFMTGNYTDTDGAVRSYAETFVEIGSNLAVSPYHLAARCKQEQGVKGTSPLISGTYSGYAGYYNFFNVRAYTTSTASATVNGLAYAKQMGWNSIYKSICGGSEVVANNYIKKGQNTIYFEKFNVVYQNSLYSHQYMTNVQASMSEGSNMSKAYTDKNQAFVFRIPVYTNMPESAVTFADKGNPNNWLAGLSVNGCNLTPAFNGATTAYSLVVGSDVSAINVNATPVAATSTVSGTGNYSLNYGNNTINITCISQSGVSRTYTITVARQQPAVTGGTIPIADGVTITSAYPVGDFVTGIQPGTSVSTVLSGISGQNCTVKVLNADGTENAGTIATGNKVTVYVNGQPVKEYQSVVYGDVNGDGKVSNIDVVLMQRHVLGITTQSGCYLNAANTNKDNSVSNIDIVIAQRHILGLSAIDQ